MKVGMAVNVGSHEKKAELAQVLERAAEIALEVGLWVEGRPFDVTLRAVAKQVTE